MIDSLARVAARPVSRETLERLTADVDRLKSEADRQNLVSRPSLEHIWERHILDSAQLVRFEPRARATWLDVGSGAGLPGIVIACLTEGPVTLLEPRRLRSEFLRATIDALGLSATVEHAKVERIVGRFNVITGRAVAPIVKFLEMSQHLSTEKTVWVLPKGRRAQSELAEAKRAWQGVFHVKPSLTDADSEIVVGTAVRAKRR